MSSVEQKARVYTLPDCPKCDELKEWLINRDIEFEVRTFDIEAQTDFIMRNMFGDPPFLEIGEKAKSSEYLFPQEKLNEEKIMELIVYDEKKE
jgi:arsenate reductase-like glutaredoxin family protein